MATRSSSPTADMVVWGAGKGGSKLGYCDAHISINRQRKDVEKLTPPEVNNFKKGLTTATVCEIQR